MEENWSLLKPTGSIPSKRCKHTCVVYNEFLLLFGGSSGQLNNDLYSFDTKKLHWSLLEPKGTLPSPRENHTAVIHKNNMYIFGGYDGGRCNDVHVYDCKLNTWKKLVTSGTPPSNREESTSVVFENSMYTFGGWDGSCCNEIFSLNLETNVWSYIDVFSDLPNRRYKHTAIVYQDKMFVFAGCVGNTLNKTSDISFFDFKKKMWKNIKNTGDEIPSKRNKHTAVLYNDSMYIFSGESSSKKCNDLFQFDLKQYSWNKVDSIGNVPSYRRSHTANVIDGSMFIFGGFDGKYYNDVYCHNLISKREILQILNRLKESKSFNDLIIVAGKKEFPCHQSIVSQSKYILELIEKKGENVQKIIIPKIDGFVFQNILNYMYGNDVEYSNWIEYLKLISSTKQFLLKELLFRLLKEFDHFVTIENIFNMLKVSYEMEIENLKQHCFLFFYKNKEKITKEKLLKQKDISNEILIDLLSISTLNKPPNLQIEYKIIPHQQRIHKHIVKLYYTKLMYDIILVSSDNQEFKAHKSILVSFSEYFSIMLSSPFQESTQNKIIINDVKAETLSLILDYIYNRDVVLPSKVDSLTDLIKVSDKFVLNILKTFAARKLEQLVNEKNAFEILQYCIEYHIEGNLKEKSFMAVNSIHKDELFEIIVESQLKQKNEIKFLRKQIEDQKIIIQKNKEKYEDVQMKLLDEVKNLKSKLEKK
eukprot:gene4740-8323_t